MNLEKHYKGKRVFITGHTGFKGSWLAEWLILLGARVTGYSLPPPTEPALFSQLGLRSRIAHYEADIRRLDRLQEVIFESKPDFVFHLAAQSLVRVSYVQPRETYEVNLIGTVNLLETLRAFMQPCAAVLVTTDKCYAETTPARAHREDDPLGGSDPYSSSKAAAEIAIASYRRSFFSGAHSKVRLASARAGNVLGGGDWAVDRIVPDCIRSLKRGDPIRVRNRTATRPWQHVLDPLRGYLELAAALAQQQPREGASGAKADEQRADVDSPFNFGPGAESRHSVLELVGEILNYWPGTWVDHLEEAAPREAENLSLSTEKARRLLGWSPAWGFPETVKQTVVWYRESSSFAPDDRDSFIGLTRQQINRYCASVSEIEQASSGG